MEDLRLIDESAASERLGMSVHYLRTSRWRGDGPPFIKVGRAVRYSPADLEHWVESHRRTSTSDVGRRTDAVNR